MGDTPLGLKWLGKDMGYGAADAPTCGKLAEVDEDGRAWVSFEGAAKPVQARCAVAESALPAREELAGAAVLLVFEERDPARPIIIGFVRERLWAAKPAVQAPPQQDVHIVQSKVLIEGHEELTLRCGQGAITMTADGRVTIKGTRLTSRASETNKVRGAVVLIN